MSHTLGVRQARKQQTRQALLDAALGLLEHQNLSSLGLREVTRAVGVSPTAFYRHFQDLSDLGVALVEESLGSLHSAIQAAMAEQRDPDRLIDRTVEIIAGHVLDHRPHIRFIARERHGGVRPVREAIATQLTHFADEVAAGLALQPVSDGWSDDDVRMLAELYVDHMVTTASQFLEATPEDEERITSTARRQLRVISLGRRHWLDS